MEQNHKYKLLDPKNDIVFHALFREENNKLTESFLSDVLKEKVKITANLDRHLDIKKITEKFGIVDLKVELSDKTKCNIEMQVRKHKDELERFLYYLANSYARQLKKNNRYSELERCINIVIVNHDIEEFKDIDKIMTSWKMMDTETGKKILTNKFELIIIELTKVVKNYSINSTDKVVQWGMFFAAPDSKEVLGIMEKNKYIKEAKEDLDYLSADYELHRIAEIRERAIHDEASALEYAEEQGLKKGLKKGLEKGLEQGLEQGLKQGLARAKEMMLKTAKTLLKKGMSVEDIIEATGLTKEEILKLK